MEHISDDILKQFNAVLEQKAVNPHRALITANGLSTTSISRFHPVRDIRFPI